MNLYVNFLFVVFDDMFYYNMEFVYFDFFNNSILMIGFYVFLRFYYF